MLLNAHNADRGVIGLPWVPSLTSSIGHEFYLQNAKQHALMKNICKENLVN